MKRTFKNNLGITLIALVITIIILLILAGVTIAALSGDNGILKNAGKAKEETEQTEEDELRRLTALEAATNLEQTTYTDNSMGEEQERTVTIPAGFAVSKVGGENTIAEGLVIIDSSGNEYVWIPVDGVLQETEGDGGKTVQDAINGEIVLGRYVFDEDGKIDTDLTPTTLKGTIIDQYKFGGLNDYIEETTGNGNAVATGENGINSFIQSVRNNQGYYIARYEAGVENGTLDISDIVDTVKAPNDNWTGYDGSNIKLVIKSGIQVWNYVTQNKASELCQNLYSEINSDLINSYAWDTAILFIQKNSGDSDYSRQTFLKETIEKTGGEATDRTNRDIRCNIYDMAGNCYEMTTETCSNYPTRPCVGRGGTYDGDYTSHRHCDSTNYAYYNCTFRPILYL